MWYSKLLILLATAAMLSACGGGNVAVTPVPTTTQTTNPPTSEVVGLNGIWTGDYTDSSGTICTDVKGLTYNGSVRVISEKCNVVLAGTLTVNGSNANVSFNLFDAAGTATGQSAFSGSFTLQSTIDGSLDNGSRLSLRYQPVYENNSSLSLLNAYWGYREPVSGGSGTILTVFNIDSAGVLPSVTTGYGCVYTAAFSILDPDYNLYAVNLTIASCSTQDGVYSGLASLSGDNKIMTILAGNQQNTFFADFDKVAGATK
ncbi:MAG: hypothetical protein GXP11_03920 [Gammaproteobacteria bacterium]|nr:hypothetical protein [Gammaproteobacteria bacterium]